MKSKIESHMTRSESLLFKQRTKLDQDHNLSESPELTGSFQLTMAAQILSKFNLSFDDEFSPPFNWNEETWRKFCLEPYKKRLILAAAFLIAEADRIEDMEAKGEEYDPLKIKKS